MNFQISKYSIFLVDQQCFLHKIVVLHVLSMIEPNAKPTKLSIQLKDFEIYYTVFSSTVKHKLEKQNSTSL